MPSTCARSCSATARQESELKWLDVSLFEYFLRGRSLRTWVIRSKGVLEDSASVALDRCQNGSRHRRFGELERIHLCLEYPYVHPCQK